MGRKPREGILRSLPCLVLRIRAMSEAQCRQDNCPLYELPTESSLGVQSILKSLTLIQHSLDIQNLMWKLVGLKLRISEVLQTLSYLSQKIHLILAVTMVVLPSLYMLWGRDPELAAFLFTYSYVKSPVSIGLYYTSLKRSFQRDHNAAGIVRNGSVFTEKLREQDNKYGP